jgi:hypothetical protein
MTINALRNIVDTRVITGPIEHDVKPIMATTTKQLALPQWLDRTVIEHSQITSAMSD